MRGIPVPDQEEDFTADPSELFFDLAFVFAFSRLVYHLVHHPDWTGVGQFALLLGMIWLPWSQFTWAANAVAGNSRPVRFLFLIATAASVPMAGSIDAAFEGGAPAFTISLALIMLMGLGTMVLASVDDPDFRSAIVSYGSPNVAALIVWITGAYVDGQARVILWLIGLAIVLYATLRAGESEWVTRAGHFAERHGLIIIVALGEVIVALGISVVDAFSEEDGAGLPARTLVALVAAGLFAGLLWWGYFDRPNPAVEQRHDGLTGAEGGRFARDVYTYSHLPLVGGIILAAAALEEITLHPSDPLETPFLWMLWGGLAAYLIAVVIFIYRAYRVPAIERLTTIGLLLALMLIGRNLDGVVLLVLIDLVLLAMLAAEHLRVEHRFRGEREPAAAT